MSLNSLGLEVPIYEEIFTEIELELVTIFGDNLNTSVDTPIGQLIRFTAYRELKVWQQILEAFNQFDIRSVIGENLSALVKLVGITRQQATYSFANVTVTGIANSVISSGFTVATNDTGTRFKTNQEYVVGVSGTVDITVYCEVLGRVEAIANTITNIITPISGVNSVTNTTDAVVGREVETDNQLRSRFFKSTTINATSTVDSIRANLLAVEGVTYASVIDNKEEIVIDGIPAKTVYAVVGGGLDQDIIDTLGLTVTCGIPTFGSISGVFIDNQNNEQIMYFDRPVNFNLTIIVNLIKYDNYPANGDTLIKENIINYIQSLQTGVTIRASDLYYYVYQVLGCSVADTGISINGSTFVDLNPNEVGFTDESLITIVGV